MALFCFQRYVLFSAIRYKVNKESSYLFIVIYANPKESLILLY